MYQSFKYTLKSLKTLYDSLQHVSISHEIIFRERLNFIRRWGHWD